MMSGSAVQACWTRVVPSSPQAAPMQLVRGLQHAAGPGQLHQGLGVGGVHQPDPAVSGGGDPVPLVIIARRVPARTGRRPARRARGTGRVRTGCDSGTRRDTARVVVGGEQDRAAFGAGRGGGVGDQFGQGHGLGFGHDWFAGAFQDEVPGVRAVEGAGAVQGRAEPAQQGRVAELDVAQVRAWRRGYGTGRPRAGRRRRRSPARPRRGGPGSRPRWRAGRRGRPGPG